MSGTDGLSNHIRKYLLDKTNYTCEIPGCGCNFINPYTGLSILQIHHIAGINNIARIKKYGDIKEIKRA